MDILMILVGPFGDSRERAETFYQDSKGHLGLDTYRMCSAEAIEKHWCLSSAPFLKAGRRNGGADVGVEAVIVPKSRAWRGGGAAQRRCGLAPGGPLQPAGTGRPAARAWGWPGQRVWGAGAGTHPGRGASDPGPGGGWDRHLVVDHPATRPAARPRWAAWREHLSDLVRAARGGGELAAGSQLVRDRIRAPQTQERASRLPRCNRCTR